jgi:hypothetical protein
VQNKMAELQLTFEQCKWTFKCYWKIKNLTEERRLWRNEFVTSPPIRVKKKASLRDKVEADEDMKI